MKEAEEGAHESELPRHNECYDEVNSFRLNDDALLVVEHRCLEERALVYTVCLGCCCLVSASTSAVSVSVCVLVGKH